MAEEAPREPVVVRDAQGQDFTVEASELDAYVRSGQYQIAPKEAQLTAAGQIPVQTSDGGLSFLDPEEAQRRIASFEAATAPSAAALQAEEEARYGGALQGARAAAAGVLRGATLGVSDQALTALDPTLAPELAGLQRYRPTASLVGEIGGAVAPLLLTGGGSGVGGAVSGATRYLGAPVRAVAALGEGAGSLAARSAVALGAAEGGAAARAVGAVARGAVEVGAFEAGREVSQAALEQRELSAGRVAEAFGNGALLGAALLGGGSLLASGARGAARGAQAAVSWAGERATVAAEGKLPFAEEALAYAQEKSLKATGGTQREIGKILEGTPGLRQAADEILTREVPRALGRAENAVVSRAEMQAGIEAVRKEVGAEMGAVLRSVDANAHGVGADVRALVQRAREEILAPLEGNVFADKEARVISREIRKLEQLADYRVGFEALHDLSSHLGKVIRRRGASSEVGDLRKFRALLEEEIEAGATRVSQEIGGDLAAQYSRARTRYAASRLLGDAVETGVKSEVKNLTFGLGEMLAGLGGGNLGGQVGASVAGPAGAAVGGLLGAGVSAAARNVMRRYGDQAVSTALRAYADSGTVAQVAGRLDAAVSETVGKYLTPRLPTRAVVDRAERAARVAAEKTASAPRQAEQRIDRALFPAAQRTRTASARAGATGAQVAQVAGRLRASKEAQRAALEATAREFPHLAPEIRGRLQASDRAHDYLLSKIPVSSNLSATLTPQAEAPRMSAAQRAAFVTALRVVSDPLSVLDSFQSGQVSREEIEALEASAPGLLQQIRAEVQTQLAQRTEPLPYRQALSMSVLLGVVGHPALDPAMLRSVQQGYAAPAPPPQPSPPVSAPKRELRLSRDWSLRNEVM